VKILIKSGRVVDPYNKLDEVRDILVEKDKISKVAKNIAGSAEKTIDAKGKIVIPGIVDMHVHLRQPGREDKETVESGTRAALKGGVTSLLAMPNTQPAMDSLESIKSLKGMIKKSAQANVYICAAITKGRAGSDLVDIEELTKEGVVAFSEDGSSLESKELLSETLKRSKKKAAVICHCEDKALSAGGVVNLGVTSTRMGLKGISAESEYARVKRNIELALKTDAPIHITHVSCAKSVEVVAQAKKKGARVTCDVTPHHFCLDESAVWGYDTSFKMNPPLRSRADIAAIKQGLQDGTIDVIASDHAPHTENDKEIEFERAEFGTIGLETELAVGITELINTEILDWKQLIRKMTLNPARILEIDKGCLSVGQLADIAIIDPDKEWIPASGGFISKSKNSSFIGRKLFGIVEFTLVAGKIVYQNRD